MRWAFTQYDTLTYRIAIKVRGSHLIRSFLFDMTNNSQYSREELEDEILVCIIF